MQCPWLYLGSLVGVPQTPKLRKAKGNLESTQAETFFGFGGNRNYHAAQGVQVDGLGFRIKVCLG